MDHKSAMGGASSLICITFFLLFTSANCFNITKIFNTWPDFSTFNSYLTQTHLAEEINRRQTITVLGVPNSAMSQISGMPIADIKKILSLHVVLDYFDEAKLSQLSKKTALLTTLFQSSGNANGQQGFLNVTDLSNGDIAFGSAVKGSSLNAMFVKKLAAQPYNISVLQISAAVIPEGISLGNYNKSASPPVAPVAAPSKASPVEAPAPSDDSSAPTAADAPAPSDEPVAVDAPAPADGPAEADAPAPADGPAEADAPAPADGPAEADAPAPADGPAEADSPLSSPPMPADGPTADAPAESDDSGSAHLSLGLFGVVSMVVVSSLVAL